MSKLDSIKKPIREELKRFEVVFKASIKSDVRLLNLITQYILRTKGKQVRPILVLLSARLFGPISERAYTAASLIELLHTASLVHDDVVDQSEQRRGLLSLWKVWKTKPAVLFGDYLLARGLLLSVDNQAFDLLRIVSEAVNQMTQGELKQLQNTRRYTLSEQDYFDIIYKKTASLIAACTHSGASAANTTEENCQKMKEFGEKLGLIFQIKDDLLDYESTSFFTGKPKATDIRERKMTLPLIHALSVAPKSERKKILSILQSPAKKDTSEKINQVISFTKEYGGIAYSYQKMQQLADEAKQIIASFSQTPAGDALIELVEYTMRRKK